jgi:hypothetical protein
VNRFRGTIAALVALVLVGVGYVVLRNSADPVVAPEIEPALFSFEKEDLVGIKVVRPDQTIEIVKSDGEWTVVGDTWRPSASMVRRIAHQIHDLTARAIVTEGTEDLALYGLEEGAITITLTLEGGEELAFRAGDPNPSSVSWYILPLPEKRVYTVKKAAIDYYRLSLEEFREHRIASLDADDAQSVDATVDGRRIRVHRTGEKTWAMDEPVAMDAARQEVRTMLGRTGALKAFEFVADAPEDLSQWGLEPPEHTVAITLSASDDITLRVGSAIADSDPPQAYVYREEDDAVYAVRSGFLEAFRQPIEKYRLRKILGKHEWDVIAMDVTQGEQQVRLEKSPDGWRWPDGQKVSGSTPKRLAGRAADIDAKAFHDPPLSAARFGLESPSATVALTFEGGTSATVELGDRLSVGQGESEQRRVYVRIAGAENVYEQDASLASVVEDLFREYGRKLERDDEKRIRDGSETVPVEQEE